MGLYGLVSLGVQVIRRTLVWNEFYALWGSSLTTRNTNMLLAIHRMRSEKSSGNMVERQRRKHRFLSLWVQSSSESYGRGMRAWVFLAHENGRHVAIELIKWGTIWEPIRELVRPEPLVIDVTFNYPRAHTYNVRRFSALFIFPPHAQDTFPILHSVLGPGQTFSLLAPLIVVLQTPITNTAFTMQSRSLWRQGATD